VLVIAPAGRLQVDPDLLHSDVETLVRVGTRVGLTAGGRTG
jgi:hypothetical protein